MTDGTTGPIGAHLVGSVPLNSSDEVFATTSAILGNHVCRMSDGETGNRSDWIRWQHKVFAECPQLEPVLSNKDDYRKVSLLRIKDGYAASEVELPALGYSAVAKESYTRFKAAKSAGRIAKKCRFQVSLPTPLAPIQFYVTRQCQASLEPVYERKLLAELDEILDFIPHDELAVQWDTAVEFAILENLLPTFMSDPEAEILERLIKLGNRIPPLAELGYHLCYGDSGHKHFIEPANTAILARVATHLAVHLDRTLDWIHLPVPRDRSDAAYFEPLRELQLQSDTKLYLGLIHITDGAEGARKRIAAAQVFVQQFGVATECGFGRRRPDTVQPLMELHAATASPIS